MRQTHDLWHVVTNAETDPAGEVALQAFTWAQVGAPSAGILAALGMLKTLRHDCRILKDVAELIRLGRAADRLVVFPWEDHWATPLAEVRRLLKLPTSPRSIGGYTKGAFERPLIERAPARARPRCRYGAAHDVASRSPVPAVSSAATSPPSCSPRPQRDRHAPRRHEGRAPRRPRDRMARRGSGRRSPRSRRRSPAPKPYSTARRW